MERITQKSRQTSQTLDRESFNSTLFSIGRRLHLMLQEKKYKESLQPPLFSVDFHFRFLLKSTQIHFMERYFQD